MPSKLQLKLLSTSGELLNVINCTSGRVCVFRGNTPSDLRPYQRALIGTHGKEKISVNVDGKDYNSEEHNVLGLGEAAPHSGMTVRQFFARCGVQDESLASLLSSYGLDGIADMKCSTLSPDQERRVRILFSISQPDKVLVANEPFEHITSQWKERFAELLLDFARLKSGLVVIPSLSYRPECWIDNSLVARIEVGQSIQRTIGFGQAGSEANEMIEELRRKIQADERGEQRETRPQAAMMSGAAAIGAMGRPEELAPPPSDFALIKAWLTSSDSMAFKIVSSLLAAGVGVGSALFVVQMLSDMPADTPPSQVASVKQPLQPASAKNEQPQGQIDSAVNNASVQAPQDGGGSAGSLKQDKPATRYILDGYAEMIKASIVNTAHGNAGEVAAPAQQNAPEQREAAKSGNFYSLLEQAGSSTSGDGGASAPPPAYEQEEEEEYNSDPVAEAAIDPTEEDQRREEIRSKFLEAIRAAAERREATMDEE